MKKRIFNPRLYLEGLKQMKLMGFILTVFTMLVTAIPPIAEIVDNIHYKYSTIGFSKNIIDSPILIAPCVMVFMYLGSYIFSSFIFSYGNKRKASDFYDSLQNTRLCTYISFGLSALTWIVAIILINNIEGIFLNNLANDVVVTAGEFIRFTVYEILVAMGVAGATFVAMALTGTAFSNFMVTALVLLLPRFCITFFQVMVLNEARTICASSLMGIWDPSHNLITGLITSLMGYGFDYLISNTWGYVYTFLLDLAYFALAGLFFHLRKTETAEKSASSNIMQHVIRCGLSLPFGLFFGWSVYYVFSQNYIEDIIIALLLFALFAFVYFVYEAITTKSFKRLGRALPLFAVILAASVATTYASIGAADIMDKRIPKADRVVGISVSNHEYNDSYHGSYIEVAESEIKYEDRVLIEKVLRDLKLSADLGDGEQPYEIVTAEVAVIDGKNDPNSSYNSLDFSDWGNYVKFFYSGGRTEIRRVDFTWDTEAYFDELKANTPEYVNAIMQLPDEDVVNCYIESLDSVLSKQVYSVYREEVQKLPFEVVRGLVDSFEGIDINVTSKADFGYSYSYFTITQDTPKALAEYMKLAKNEERVKNFFMGIRSDDAKRVTYVDLYMYNATSGNTIAYNLAETVTDVDADVILEIDTLINEAVNRDPGDKNYTMYTFNGYSDREMSGGEYYHDSCQGAVLFMTQKEMMRLAELLEITGVTSNIGAIK